MFKSNTSTSNNSYCSFLSAGATLSVRSEIFQLSCRPPAFVIGAVVNWLGVFVIGTSFPFIVVSDFPWDTELKSAAGAGRVTGGDSATPSHRELSTCSPKAAFQLKGPDLPKIFIQTEILVQGKNAKNSLSDPKYFGTQIKNCAKKVTMRKTCLSHSPSIFALPCRKDSSTSASSFLWWYFSLQGSLSTCSFQKQKGNQLWKSQKNLIS